MPIFGKIEGGNLDTMNTEAKARASAIVYEAEFCKRHIYIRERFVCRRNNFTRDGFLERLGKPRKARA